MIQTHIIFEQLSAIARLSYTLPLVSFAGQHGIGCSVVHKMLHTMINDNVTEISI